MWRLIFCLTWGFKATDAKVNFGGGRYSLRQREGLLASTPPASGRGGGMVLLFRLAIRSLLRGGEGMAGWRFEFWNSD